VDVNESCFFYRLLENSHYSEGSSCLISCSCESGSPVKEYAVVGGTPIVALDEGAHFELLDPPTGLEVPITGMYQYRLKSSPMTLVVHSLVALFV
jgi:hypothetical protein